MASAAKKTVQDFGYDFNEAGKLRKIDPTSGQLTDEPFEFQVSSSHEQNQRNYEALGDAITAYVYELLEQKGLHKLYAPADVAPAKATFIFSTAKELKRPEKLLILIHGSGVVRSGQWARSLIINHSLAAGTVLPYIEQAKALGYEVLVTNTNDNFRDSNPIPHNETPTKHAQYVWANYVRPADPEGIAIVAHSYGGVVAADLAHKFRDDFDKKVFAVALTDSVHSSSAVSDRLKQIGKNYVSSSEKLDTPVRTSASDIPRVSAGHPKHEMTSYACKDSLFEFLEKNYEEFKMAPDAKKLKTEF